MKQNDQFGPWSIEYIPADGARISRLTYEKIDLLTAKPQNFTAPQKDYGLYETRPVYGYDDCFPSVDACDFPDIEWRIPDHGELCWLPWKVKKTTNGLAFEVTSQNLTIQFKRRISFADDQLVWSFAVENRGSQKIPFQHVMHPLLPLKNITDICLPQFGSVFDDIQQKTMPYHSPEAVREFLLSRPARTTNMLFLQNIKEGRMSWEYGRKLGIEASFSKELFPTIGIWWNNNQYPDEQNCRRNECALEPTPGLNSTLLDAFRDRKHLEVLPGEIFGWQITWRIHRVT